VANQFRGGDELVGLADFSHSAAEAAEAQSRKPCTQRHHREVSDADSIPRSCKAEKKEGAKIGGDQCEKQHTCLQATICQEVAVGLGLILIPTSPPQPEQGAQIEDQSDQRACKSDVHERAIQAAVTVSETCRRMNNRIQRGRPITNICIALLS